MTGKQKRRSDATGSSTASSTKKTEITLCCLVHGQPSGSYFEVTVEKNFKKNELRKKIREISEPELDKFSYWSLKLWIVDIPLSTPNLGDSSVNIVNEFHGREFPPKTEVGKIFTEQPNEDNIQIIIELPVPAEETHKRSLVESIAETIAETTQKITQQFAKTT
ncbi:hypothetical protein C2G38_2213540 [Gigaspora rosea]|uniref:Crinkler effector protein N-terminal domain-containing protein n=1 Tax=Gigaspora rosea TaxID=44941 RepID=A0A397UBW7_9GLOM|nr:hypothetical protein C2G38_2213540 [Gigaspora rosea]CAG8700510.1 15307_t:CDS:2 [Gigaspora rosea]